MAIGSHIRPTSHLLLAAGVLVLTMAVAGCSGGREASLEERAQSIDKSLICPVCPSETIDQSRVQLAEQMRALVREKLAEGWSAQQIRDYFVDSYGEDVLAAPPKSGFNLIAWVVPIVAIAAALLLLATVILAMRRSGSAWKEEVSTDDRELEPYLSMVDSELGIAAETPPEPEVDRG